MTATDRPRADPLVIALGSINVDHVFPGGKAANAAVVARHLGARVALFGWVGDDGASRLAVAGPQAAGVDVTAVGAAGGAVLITDLEVPAGIVHDAVAEAVGRNVRTVLDPAPPEAVTPELLASAHVVTPDHAEAQTLTGTSTDSDDGAVRAAVMATTERGGQLARFDRQRFERLRDQSRFDAA